MTRENKTDWMTYFSDVQLILLAMILTNSINTMNDGFSWLGLGVLLSSVAFVVLTLYMKNTRFPK
jgi:hypothetical protein